MMLMDRGRQENLVRFGLRFGRAGAHLARSMMLDDLRRLLEHVPDVQAGQEEFARAIRDDNCLGKRSARTRSLSLRHLISLYALEACCKSIGGKLLQVAAGPHVFDRVCR